MQRSAGVVVMNPYAPLLGNLIGYDARRGFGSPSCYARPMFSMNIG